MDAVHFSSKTEEWATPQDFFDKLNEEFHFTLDVCSTHENAKCAKHYTKYDDGLSQDWTGETVWCNPPYCREVPKWLKKCAEHAEHGGLAVMLLPARTDTKWFHEYIYGKYEIRFVKGRLCFVGTDGATNNRAPFPSMVVVFRQNRLLELSRKERLEMIGDEDGNDLFTHKCPVCKDFVNSFHDKFCSCCGSRLYTVESAATGS